MIDSTFDVDTEIDLGPLTELVGVWRGDKGHDVSPEPDATEINEYREQLTFRLTRRVVNAEQQKLAVVAYEQIVHRKRDNKIIHDQLGYWMWDAEQQQVQNVFSLPRGITAICQGTVDETQEAGEPRLVFSVEALRENSTKPISQSVFMQQKATVDSYQLSMTLTQNRLSYKQLTVVDIYGKHFSHEEHNQLERVN